MREGSQFYRIGFDMDGVLIDHTEIRIRLAKEIGFFLSPEQTPSDILRTIIPKDKRSVLQNTLYNNPQVALEAQIMDGAYEGISILAHAGLSIFLISRRKDPQLAIRLLSKHKLWPDYFNEENTYFVAEIEDKNEKAKVFQLTHYIDDEEGVLNALVDVPNKILFDQHNASENNTYRRINDWESLIEHLLNENPSH
ncbi:MAG: hypothetical protein LiPW41_732 [Parcubacteria group bacterium LiPW_41]|nr:MAG: hypothetical protein LiPW41_732 [Parcubacteria group bacterium LiPW_41]